MSGSFRTSDDNTEVSFRYSASTSKIQAAVINAAELVYEDEKEENDPSFSTLNNQQKLDVLDAHLKAYILTLAKKNYIRQASLTARQEAIENADSEVEL